MTTRVHTTNLGPDAILVQRLDDARSPVGDPSTVWPGECYTQYVYDSQSLLVSEKPMLMSKPDEKS